MRSDICKIDNSTKDLEAIFRESEKVAEYNGLESKQALQLRLICEEVDGMLPNIIEDFSGSLWIEYENGVCKVNISLRFEEFTVDKKKELVGIAKNKKNAAEAGIVGKIRSAVENFFLDEDVAQGFDMSAESFYFPTEHYSRMNYFCIWSLEQYRTTVDKEPKPENWDELEKSVLASVADDVIVGVKGKQADIIIVKKFA